MKFTRNLILCLITIIFISTLADYAYAPPTIPHEPIGDPIPLPTYSAELSVSLYTYITTGVILRASGISFNYSSATQVEPWVVSNQFIRIEFYCDYNVGFDGWGLRIITDNVNDLAEYGDVEGNIDPGDDGISGTGDDLLLYGGLINTSHVDNQFFRTVLAWQVYDDFTRPSSLTPPEGEVVEVVGNEWRDDMADASDPSTTDWAYLGDKGDTGYEGDVVETGYTDDRELIINYSNLAWGQGSASRYLARHPNIEDVDGSRGMEDDDGDGLWDIYVYIAGRFWNNAYIDTDNDGDYETPVYFQLPAGDYQTTVYIELFHE